MSPVTGCITARWSLAFLLAFLLGGFSPPTPWRLYEALSAPRWLRSGLEHRARFEHLENDFRSTCSGGATALSLRTRVSAELRFEPFIVGAELKDSRAYASDETPLNTTIVNGKAGDLHRASARGPSALAATAANLALEVGVAYLVRGEFAKQAPGARSDSPLFVYSQVTGAF